MFTAQDDINMMKDPKKWPYKVFLPVKNYQSRDENHMPIMGVMLAGLEQVKQPVTLEDIQDDLKTEPRVYLISLSQWAQDPSAVFHAEKMEYESFEALVRDGWMVD